MKLSIVAPCFNEIDTLPKLFAELLPAAGALVGLALEGGTPIAAVEILLVDDGSTDGTQQAIEQRLLAETLPPAVAVRVAAHKQNLGLGAALRTGFAQASGDIIVTVDSDGTYGFATIPDLLARLTPGVDLVTASPYHPNGGVSGVPAYRLLLSRGSSIIYRLLVDRSIHTYTALFRAYRRAVVEQISFEADGYLAGTELLVKAVFAGFGVAEYPTVLYVRTAGTSKAKLVRTIRAHLRFQCAVAGYRLRALKSRQAALPRGGL